jgi:3-oxoacyl-[acyl-carrier protein] reductase
MDLGISGMKAAVAAGSAGLGLSTARALAAEGVQVAICGRDADRVDAAVAELGGDAVGFAIDVGTSEAATGFVEQAIDALGQVDILVTNAGGPPLGTFESTDIDAYRHALDLNLLSTVAMARAAVPAMRERRWGRVVAITSIGAKEPIGNLMASSVARAGVTSFVKITAREVARDGVTVNSAQPGLHLTERVRAFGRPEDLAANIPARFVGDPDDFGAAVAFLCSQQARFITGTGLLLDGGATAGLFG